MQQSTDSAVPNEAPETERGPGPGESGRELARSSSLLPPSSVLRSIDLRELAAIFLGGAAGALLRVWIGLEFVSSPSGWPWAIFAINISGCVVLSYVATRLQERLPQSTYRRPLLATGFCGAYTTFSTVQVEIVMMLDGNHYGLAAGYAATSVTAGYVAIWLATAGVRRVRTVT